MSLAKVHFLASPEPLRDNHPYTVGCGAEISKVSFAGTGDKDLRFSDLREFITCPKCKALKDPGARYYYAAVDGDRYRVVEE